MIPGPGKDKGTPRATQRGQTDLTAVSGVAVPGTASQILSSAQGWAFPSVLHLILAPM